MTTLQGKVLLIGYGNPGRLDDGLGPALALNISQEKPDHVTVESEYQLVVEYAEMISGYDTVIFADASVSCPEPYEWSQVEPSLEAGFSTHIVSPSSILGIAQDLFDARTEAYLLTIRGYEFDDFGERLSPKASKNLQAGTEFLKGLLEKKCCEVQS